MAAITGIVWLLVGLVTIALVAKANRRFAAALLFAFAARAGFALLDAFVVTLPGKDDSLRYDAFAFRWARYGLAGTFDHIDTGAALYTWFCSVFYAVFGRSMLMMQAINALFGSLIVLNVGRLAELLRAEPKLAVRAAWLTAAFPSLVFFSGSMLREVAVAYPLSVGVLSLVRWYRGREARHMLAAVVAFLISMAFHSGAVAVLLAAGLWLVGSWVRSLFTPRLKHFGRNTIALVAGAAAIAFVVSSNFGLDKLGAARTGDPDAIADTQANYAHGRAAYLQDLRPQSTQDLVAQTPLRVVYFLFAPFPWMISTPTDLIGVVDSLFFLSLFVRLWMWRRVVIARREVLLVLAVFGAMALTFATGVSNYGTAQRHRSKMLPLLIGASLAMPAGGRRAARDAAKGRAGEVRTVAARRVV